MYNNNRLLPVIVACAIAASCVLCCWSMCQAQESEAVTSEIVKPPAQVAFERLQADIGEMACGKKNGKTYVIDRVINIVDGDTIDVLVTNNVALPMKKTAVAVTSEYRLRFLGVDTPESNRVASKVEGLAAKEFTTAWLDEHKDNLMFIAFGIGKYGRPLTHVCDNKTGECLNRAIVNAGHNARPESPVYCGGKRG